MLKVLTSCRTSLLLFAVIVGIACAASAATQPASGPASTAPAGQQKQLRIQVVRGDNQQPLGSVKLRINIDGRKSEGTTDAEGRFALSIPLEWQDVTIHCAHDGFVPTAAFWMKRHYALGIPPVITIPMEPGTSIGGIVRDEAGKPIAGVKVAIGTGGPSVTVGHAIYAAVQEHVVTDASGRWRCDLLPANIERLTIMLTHPDYLSDTQYFQRPRPRREDLRSMSAVFIMGKGLTISGKVRNAKGEPVVGATVSRNPRQDVVSWYQDVKTDTEGRFAFEHVPPGQAVITVTARGYAPSLTVLKAEENSPPLAIQLEPGHTIRARVVDPHGRPVDGAYVTSRNWREYATFLRSAKTDAEGRFAIEDAPADEVRFEIHKEGYFEGWDQPLSAEAGEQVITLKPVLKVHGKVVDARTGQPIPAFDVVPGFSREGGGPIVWDESHRKKFKGGHYEMLFDFPRPGHALWIEADGYRAASSPTYTGIEGDVAADFKLEPGQGPAGVVKGPDGKPISGAQISVAMGGDVIQVRNGQMSGHSRYETITTGDDGRFELPAFEGDYVVIAMHDRGYALLSKKEFEARPELKLEPWARVEGTLKAAIRPGVPERVSAFYLMSPTASAIHWGYRVDVDPTGRFVIDRLVAGKARVMREVILKQHGDTQTIGQGESAEVTLQAGQTARVTLGQ